MKYVLLLVLLLGCSSTEPEPVNADPVATFSASTTEGAPPLTVVFDGGGSSNAAGFVWNLGDDSVIRGERVTHTFGEVGAYEVRLWVTGEDGALSAPATRVITVREDQPTPPTTPEPPVSLTYGGQWAWLAEFDNGIIFRGVATIGEAVSEPDFTVSEGGTWRQCNSANQCPSTPDGAALIGETVLAGEVSLAVTFESGRGAVVLLAVDNDGALGSELAEETFFGRGIWVFADGREEAVNFVMTRSQ